MKGKVRVLVLDGTPNAAGLVIKPEGLELPLGDAWVVLEDQEYTLHGIAGRAKLTLDNNVVYADLELLNHKLPEPARMVLYPVPHLVAVEWKGQVVTKSIISRLKLSITKSDDPRIDTIGNQGLRP